jgi:hypothetical protein
MLVFCVCVDVCSHFYKKSCISFFVLFWTKLVFFLGLEFLFLLYCFDGFGENSLFWKLFWS